MGHAWLRSVREKKSSGESRGEYPVSALDKVGPLFPPPEARFFSISIHKKGSAFGQGGVPYLIMEKRPRNDGRFRGGGWEDTKKSGGGLFLMTKWYLGIKKSLRLIGHA